jgi:DNA adenine methylase
VTTRTSPFLKWVGGKSQLLRVLSKLITNKSLTYYEPFIGGGATFFHFADRRRFRRAILNDFNPELINAYAVVRDHLPELLARLDQYRLDADWNTEAQFKRVRAVEHTDPVEMAARTLYLNRLCFNGLYRVNRSGKFNAPFGKYDNPSLYDRANILACSEALQNFATLRVGDYAAAVHDAQSGDIVYFDPPYVPVSETSNFTSYSGQFGADEQRALASLFRELVGRGVMCIESNSDAPLVHELYEGFDLHVVGAKRNVNSKGDKRGKVNELVVVGRPKHMKIDVPTDYLPAVFPLECADCGTTYITSDIVCTKCGSTQVRE